MAILIVDDENSTREVLITFLKNLGHTSVLVAKDGEEALGILDEQKFKVKMVISDLEMPGMNGLTLLERVSSRQELDLSPFLLITSESQDFTHPRLDGCLLKPFQSGALKKALVAAYAHRYSTRNVILYIGRKQLVSFREAMQSGHNSIWKDYHVAESPEQVTQLAEKYSRTIGAIVVEAATYLDWNLDWLQQFRKTPSGETVQMICLSKDEESAISLRSDCNWFFTGQILFDRWMEILERISQRTLVTWERDDLLGELKKEARSKNYKQVKKIAESILKLSPQDNEVLCWLAQAHERLGDARQASECFKQALEVNPFHPSPYLRLETLQQNETPALRQATARKGAKLCPRNLDVLLSGARTLIATQAIPEALSLLEQVLHLDPKNSEAIKLKRSLK